MECFNALASGFVSKIGEMLVEPIAAQFGYLIYHDNNINNMNDALKVLEDKKQEVQLMVDADERSGREILPNVKRWLREVIHIETELQKFCEDDMNRNKKCLGGWCPNLNTRYSFSKRAKKAATKLLILKEEKLEPISCPAPPLKLTSTFTRGIKSFESRKSIIKEIIEKLKDERFKRISICGMGGVGKTTLVKEVIKIVEADKLFDEVVMTVVSQTPDYKKIQGEIADKLGLKLDKETLQGRANQLLDRINKINKILIVLDDVWVELDFEFIGLPSNENHCKVIFTSRNEGACHKMGSQETFTLNTLTKEESWDLFGEIVGDDVVNNHDIHPIAKDIANECGGLPIAIVTVGKALLGSKENYIWNDALAQLKNSSGSFSEVQKCIELSYNLLDRVEVKYFLFLCCLFPEDFDIPIEVLMREGWGLGLFKDQDALWKVRDQAHSLTNHLKRRYLLLDSNEKECVKMHDVVRDVVISIASTKEQGFSIQCEAEKKWGGKSTWDCNAVSIMIDGMKEYTNVKEYPKLELLQMESKGRQYIPKNFFQGMSNLKVLCLQDMCIPKVPSQFGALNNLRTLRLEKCQVGDVSIIGKALINLEILSFAYSTITELPVEIGQLVFLRLLDLTRCDHLEKFSPNVLTSLPRLEEFYFTVKNFPWIQNSAILIELKRISHKLKVVELGIRKVEMLPKDFIFKNLERFWVYFDSYTNFEHCTYLDSNLLKLEDKDMDCNSIKCSMVIKQLVKKCEVLKIGGLKSMKNAICELDEGGLPCLKDLEVINCDKLEYLIDGSEEQKSMTNFSNLLNLRLSVLPSLMGFSKANDLNEPRQSMIKVQELSGTPQSIQSHLESGGKLFSHNWMQQFPQLETILLDRCTSLETVFDCQGSFSQSDSQLPQLKEIRIQYLDKLGHVWSNVPHCVEGFQNLRSLVISNCDSLGHLFTFAFVRAITKLEKLKIMYCKSMKNLIVGDRCDEEDNNKDQGKQKNVPHCVEGFQNLRSLVISNCDSLGHLFTFAIVRAITKLEKLEITYCKSMKNLIVGDRCDEEDNNKDKGKQKNVVFEKLDSLTLSSLPELMSICADSYELEWPSLQTLSIDDCPKLKMSSLLIQTHANQDNLSVTSFSSLHNARVGNFKENYSASSHWQLGCTSLPRLIRKGGTNKRSSKAVLLAHDHEPSISEMKTRGEIGRVPIPTYLKTIEIGNCDKLETIVGTTEKTIDTKNSFAQVESLDLQELPNLVRFCLSEACTHINKQEDRGAYEGDQLRIRRDPFIDGFLFPNLTSLVIRDCNKISILFSPSSSNSLERLEELDIRDCENIEEIVSQEEREASVNKILFRGLKYLSLKGLPNLKAFCQGSYDLDFPLLRSVTITNCPNMKVFSRGSAHTPKLVHVTMTIGPDGSKHGQMGDPNATVALQSSRTLSWSKGIVGYFIGKSEMYVHIRRFPNLSSLVSFNEIHMLQPLQALTIRDCDSLDEVFKLGGGIDAYQGDATMHITHYELQFMDLENLPKLRHIWKSNIARLVSFQKLKSIMIIACHNLKSLLPYSVAESLVQLEHLHVRDCRMMEEIVTKDDENIKGGSKIKILFPKLKSVLLFYLPKLECFCSGYYDYDIPLCDDHIIVGQDKEMNKVEISFPELEELYLIDVPNLKCFCSGAYDYDPIPSSCNEEIIEELPRVATFPNETVTVSTPKLPYVRILPYVRSYGSIFACTPEGLNLTIHYARNSEIYRVELQKLETFRCIEQDPHLLGYITTVAELELESCDKLSKCFPSNMMHRFKHLQRLRVKQCDNLEEIFESEGATAAVDASGNDYEIDSRMQYDLDNMELGSLPKLMYIWKNHGRVLSFQKLGHLRISGCHNLKFVFPFAVARNLPKLSELHVSDCNKMEEIIVTEEEQIDNISEQQQQLNEAMIIFPWLRSLKLEKLPSLHCFCPSSFDFELPSCGDMVITECPEMETFCNGTLYTPLLNSLSVENTEYRGQNLNEIIRMRHPKS